MDNVLDVYSAMQTEKPYATYKKAILGMVAIHVLDPFQDKPIIQIMKGDPSKNDEGCLIDVWTVKEDVFLRKMNKNHFAKGNLIPFARKEEYKPSEEELLNSMTDEDMLKLLEAKWFTLQSSVSKMTSPAPLYRLLTLAQEMERPEKTLELIRARLSELS
jgi:hypothetical protein